MIKYLYCLYIFSLYSITSCSYLLSPFYNHVNAFQKSSIKCSSTCTSVVLSMNANPSPAYLERMVERKKVQVDRLLRQHQEPDDPLVMRMSYMASECKYNITKVSC